VVSPFVKASPGALVCGLTLLVGACALANTPQQELAYARWAQCRTLTGELLRIDLDGRITFRSSTAGGRQEVLQCLAAAGRSGPPLPEPIGVGFPGGP
jgi:hypothetical protein